MERRTVLLVGGLAGKVGELSPFFASKGIDLVASESGIDAFRMCWQLKIDALILDTNLKDMNATEFLKKIASLVRKLNVDVFLVADDARWEDVVGSLPEESWPSGHIRSSATPFEMLYAITGQRETGDESKSTANADAPEPVVRGVRVKGKLPESGSLKRYAPERVLVLLNANRFSGVASFERENGNIKLEFGFGQLKAFVARGIKVADVLDLALELGLISPHAHKKVARLSEVRKVPPEQLLLELNELRGEDLEAVYKIQGIRKIQTLFGPDWKEGEFRIDSNGTLGSEGRPVDTSLGRLIIDGILAYGDPERIERFFDKYEDRAFVRNYRTPFSLSELALSDLKADLLLKIDGKTPLAELKLGGYEESHTKPFLYALWTTGFISPVKQGGKGSA